MIVNCSQCGAKYRISEEKIDDRSLKAKCRQCGAVMIVRPPNESAAEAAKKNEQDMTASLFEDSNQSPVTSAGTEKEEIPSERGDSAPEADGPGSGEEQREPLEYQDILAEISTPAETDEPKPGKDQDVQLQYLDVLGEISTFDEERTPDGAGGAALPDEDVVAPEEEPVDESATAEGASVACQEFGDNEPAAAEEGGAEAVAPEHEDFAGPGEEVPQRSMESEEEEPVPADEDVRIEYREIEVPHPLSTEDSGEETSSGIGVFHDYDDSTEEKIRRFKPGKKVSAEEVIAEIIDNIKQTFPEHGELFRQKINFRNALTPEYNTPGNRLKMKLFAAVAPVFPVLLHPREYVQCIARGYQFFAAELIFGLGVLTRMYNNYAILCSGKRILVCNLSYLNRRTTHYFFQMDYTAIAKVERRFLGRTLIFTGKNGERRIFQNIKPQLAEELELFINGKITEPAEGEQPQLIQSLCPSCYTALKPGLEFCSACSITFKKRIPAVIKSLILPGLGNISLGYHLLGVLELMGGLAVWGLVIKVLLQMFIHEKYIPFTLELTALVIYNGLDAFLTWLMAKKGYMAKMF